MQPITVNARFESIVIATQVKVATVVLTNTQVRVCGIEWKKSLEERLFKNANAPKGKIRPPIYINVVSMGETDKTSWKGA